MKINNIKIVIYSKISSPEISRWMIYFRAFHRTKSMNDIGRLFIVVLQKLKPFGNTPDRSTQRNIYYKSRPFHFLYGDNLRPRETRLRKPVCETGTAHSFITESAIRSATWIISSRSFAHYPLECEQVVPDAKRRLNFHRKLSKKTLFSYASSQMLSRRVLYLVRSRTGSRSGNKCIISIAVKCGITSINERTVAIGDFGKLAGSATCELRPSAGAHSARVVARRPQRRTRAPTKPSAENSG